MESILVVVITDKRKSMLEDVDFMNEAKNVEFFRRYLEVIGLMRQASSTSISRD